MTRAFGGSRLTWWLTGVAVVLAIAVAVSAVLVQRSEDGGLTARYEASNFMTPHPFTEPVLASSSPVRSVLPAQKDGADLAVYRPSDACDPGALKAALAADSGAASAWAQVLGIGVGEIDSYIDGLTSATLLVPLQVTNHDYESGSPRELQSVLEAGTAVLVDAQGVPRVRCACGNPLKPAKAKADKVSGAPSDFDIATVQTSVRETGPEPAGTDCGRIQLPDAAWATVRTIAGEISCSEAIAVAYDYTEVPELAADLPALIHCGDSGAMTTACRSVQGTVEVASATGEESPPQNSLPQTSVTQTALPQTASTTAEPEQGPGTVCGSVTTAIGSAPVIIQSGTMSCSEAMETAEWYFGNLSRVEGSGAHLDVGRFHCSRAVLPDRPMSDSYTRCAVDGGDPVIQIGS